MSRATAVLALVLVAVPAAASARCRETPPAIGYYARCGAFGAWSIGAMVAWEVGVSMLRFDASEIDAEAGTPTAVHFRAAPGDDRALTATGGRARWMLGLGRTFYFAGQLDLAAITSGPSLVPDSMARDVAATGPATGGAVLQGAFLLGLHRRVGAVSFGAELGVGVRFAAYSANGLPLSAAGTAWQAWPVLDAQPKVDFWLSPSWSIGVEGGFDLLHPDAVGVAVMLGGHAMPFDSAR